ncbi:5-(carboxyamino)imidazole ribonucleotide synthase [Kordiimonas sp. SCSIO 12610]|uniref:5-(carboxyamino)imidazole ribonucleotide synthase n=1 Tax=Kordiimonas sp. SCSIO 12610 TaxID=2829597 RepID=UPI00210AA5D7|nr:5-(carboxyamino)imidazole ribonucleotide synthase [Kordiimonas sp. SCSIO 12610]UTW55811.1 5-(carboxyamino)imidazole ribonucleotide synthase [Kordiimonas sp. SCSIO 12610]
MTRIEPGSTIGIMGGGQLGRMLALAAAQLGYKCHIFCPEENCPAGQVSDKLTIAEYDDETALEKFANAVDVVTYEFENIPATTAKFIADRKTLRPGVKALEITQDRLSEKNFLNDSGVETAPYLAFQTADDLEIAFKEIGRPSVAKTRRFGYDGKGQVMIKSRSDKDKVIGITNETPAILEGFVNFDREISVVVARNASSDVAAFPVGENVHTNHILDTTTVPANIREIVEAKAKVIAAQVANALDYVGVLAVEMFVKDDTGDVIVNEIAPRVHNSGHWTIEGAKTSQFEQHIRAICDLPLGSPEALGKVVMKNLLGEDILDADKYLTDASASYHHYGKSDPRPGRKMGHVTWVEANN